jgi:signal transduction histidine kinase
VRQFAFKKDTQLTCEIPSSLQNLNIYVDELRVRQVLINLLNNAVKFTPTGGQVTLSIHLEANGDILPVDAPPPVDIPYQICFSVRDSGIGIAPEQIGLLFQSFVQLDSSLNRQYNGTGVGLALVKRFVELHHGTVSVQSQVGQGSCFSAYFPCYPRCDQ